MTYRCPRCGTILPPQQGNEMYQDWLWVGAWPFHRCGGQYHEAEVVKAEKETVHDKH